MTALRRDNCIAPLAFKSLEDGPGIVSRDDIKYVLQHGALTFMRDFVAKGGLLRVVLQKGRDAADLSKTETYNRLSRLPFLFSQTMTLLS